MSRASACLTALHRKLNAQGILAAHTRRGGGQIWVDAACVAFVHNGKIVMASVIDGIEHSIERLPAKTYEPSPYAVDIDSMAIEARIRILVRRDEDVKFQTWKRLRLAGHACPGATCAEPLCSAHARDPEACHAA